MAYVLSGSEMINETRNVPDIDKIEEITLIAGKGSLPRHVYDQCVLRGIACNVIAVKDQVSTNLFDHIPHDTIAVHAVTKMLKRLREFGTRYVTLAGQVRRSNIPRLILDPHGTKLLSMIMHNGLNDSCVLSTIISFFEKMGFCVIAPELIAPDLMAPKGLITAKIVISPETKKEIEAGVEILKCIAKFDVGQAIVIQSGLVLGVEAAEGTNELIRRCGSIQQKNSTRPILVKISKPCQDKRVDLPCVGPDTIDMLHANNFMGLVLESESSLILESKSTLSKACDYGIFIYGI